MTIPTLEEFRKTIQVSQTKTGKGDKQEDLWYLRDQDDSKGERGSQVTVLNKAAVEWQILRSYGSLLQHLYNRGEIDLSTAQQHAGAFRIRHQEQLAPQTA